MQARFDDLVEGVRAGTIVAYDGKAYQRWRSERKQADVKGLKQLIQAAGGVSRETPEFRAH